MVYIHSVKYSVYLFAAAVYCCRRYGIIVCMIDDMISNVKLVIYASHSAVCSYPVSAVGAYLGLVGQDESRSIGVFKLSFTEIKALAN